ncbi:ankyrin repeat domain-containing protein [Wolbachia pipientis]|uniref:ankyrin repeat domain-containing protein n=1 Tax=Wolbachia pipientis TaxID=955 RepID=UPI0020B70742|nr:ankyrin repeat domain-containing protein [Wolbachia pipientis]
MSFNRYIQGNSFVVKNGSININDLVNFLQNKTEITTLILDNVEIDDQDIKALTNCNFPNLTSIGVVGNKIGYEGAEALANGSLSNLTSLDLHCNGIGNEGAEALANGNLSSLISLDLGYNNIDDQGIKSLAECLPIKIETRLKKSDYTDDEEDDDKYLSSVRQAWLKSSSSSKLNQNISKWLFFELAKQENAGKRFELLLNDFYKYPYSFLIFTGSDELDHFTQTENIGLLEILLEYGARINIDKLTLSDDQKKELKNTKPNKEKIKNLLFKILDKDLDRIKRTLNKICNSYDVLDGLIDSFEADYNNDKKSIEQILLGDEIGPKQIKEAYQQVVQKINPSLKTSAIKKLAAQSERSLSNLNLVEKLFEAVKQGNSIEAGQCLKKEKAIVNARDNDGGGTPLYWAIHNGHMNTARLLLGSGADPSLVTNKGNTPLHMASSKGNNEIVRLLLENIKPDKLSNFINAQTTIGKTSALHIASNIAVTRSLLQYGAVYNIKNKEGQTPLDLAKNDDIRKLLSFTNELFEGVKKGNRQVISKLRNLEVDDFMGMFKKPYASS